MTSQILEIERCVCYDGSSKQNGGGQAASILQRRRVSDKINLAETFIFVGRIVHICWPNRSYFVAETSMKLGTFRPKTVAETDLGRNVPLPSWLVQLQCYECERLAPAEVCRFVQR